MKNYTYNNQKDCFDSEYHADCNYHVLDKELAERRAAQRVNTIFLLIDIIDYAALETESLLKQGGLFKHSIKSDLNTIKGATKRLVKWADRTDPKQAEAFGETSDELREKIYKILGVE